MSRETPWEFLLPWRSIPETAQARILRDYWFFKGRQLDPQIPFARQLSMESLEVMELFKNLDPDLQDQIAILFELDAKALILLEAANSVQETPASWLTNKSLNAREALLCGAWDLDKEGKTILRVSDVTDHLERLGRLVHNAASSVRFYAAEVPPFTKIISDKLGRNGMTFQLTSEGILEAESLHQKHSQF